MNRPTQFLAVWCGAFMLIGQFVQYFVGQPILPLANAGATVGFGTTLVLSVAVAWFLSKPRSTVQRSVPR